MKRRNLAAITAFATIAAVVPATGAAFAAGTGTNGKAVLANSGVSRLAAPGQNVTYLGAAPSTQSMTLILQLPQRNQALMNQLLAKGTVISPAQYQADFGADKAQVARVTAWAKSQGLTVTQVSAASGQVFVSGNVQKVNAAFGVHVQRASLGSTTGLAVNSNPTVPANLGLTGVSGLNTVHHMQKSSEKTDVTRQLSTKLTTAGRMSADSMRRGATAAAAGSTSCSTYFGQNLYPSAKKYTLESNAICGYSPQQLVAMYGPTAYQKQTPTVGILLWDNAPDAKAVANEHFTQWKYPLLKSYTAVAAKSTGACDGPDGVDYGEQSLDIQMSHTIAPNSPIIYYGAADCSDAALTSMLQTAVTAHKVSTLSMSFGNSSDAGMTSADIAAWARPLQQAALTGISTFASSGDYGNNSTLNDGTPGVGTPSSFPYVTSVGGTAVGLGSSNNKIFTAGWENRVFLQPNPAVATFTDATSKYPISGATGGVSATFAMPAWQKGHVNGISSTKRAVPDVSALGDGWTGVDVLVSQASGDPEEGTYGGTSVASPLIAAMVALAKAGNHVTMGNVAAEFYSLAGTSAITDVNFPNKAGIFWQTNEASPKLAVFGLDAKPQNLVTAKGWDNVTGVGTPSGPAFFTAFK